METLNAQVELPKALRSFIRVGAYFKEVLDKADVNAQARAEAGQQPNLLDDVMKDGQVHIANLEEVLADITGRTKAKSVIELMTHAHGLMGIYNTVSDMLAGADEGGAGEGARAPQRAPSQAPRPANDGSPPSFRPEFTSAAKRAGQAAASAASAPGFPSAPTAQEAPAPTARTETAPTTDPTSSLEATLNAFTMEVARHLQAFEEAVAVEQTELRGRMIHQSLEAAGLRARIQVLESKLVPAARAPASATEEHAAVPAAEPIAAAAPAAAPVAAPASESADRPMEPRPQEAANDPATLGTHEPANDPATLDTHGVVDAKISACVVEVSSMIIESHTRVHTSLTSDRAKADATDEELRALRKNVVRLEGMVGEGGDRRPVEGEQGLIVAPPSESRLE